MSEAAGQTARDHSPTAEPGSRAAETPPAATAPSRHGGDRRCRARLSPGHGHGHGLSVRCPSVVPGSEVLQEALEGLEDAGGAGDR
ncbi:hypothetical protein, partial [Streptomyces shenzhenensis]|uniref:hypothetical protein n=1 Tax=Streptomyces shenzhenensis TaxID=943815 RepID=UPI001C68E0A9